jgi:phospholipid transport system substrate-binding protein
VSRPRPALTLVVLAAVLACAHGLAHAGTPGERLHQFFGAVDTVLADRTAEPLDKVARVKRLVTDLSDVRAAAADALDTAWEARTPAERDEFTSLFAELLERAYVGRLAGAVRAHSAIEQTWTGETVERDEATVRTALTSRDGSRVRVEYRMVLRRGRWLVRDVVLDGVSVVANYRAQFRRLLGQGTYGELVETLRAKLAEDTLMFARADRSTTRAGSDAPTLVSPVALGTAPLALTPPPARVAPRPPTVISPPAPVVAARAPAAMASASPTWVAPPPVAVAPPRVIGGAGAAGPVSAALRALTLTLVVVLAAVYRRRHTR